MRIAAWKGRSVSRGLLRGRRAFDEGSSGELRDDKLRGSRRNSRVRPPFRLNWQKKPLSKEFWDKVCNKVTLYGYYYFYNEQTAKAPAGSPINPSMQVRRTWPPGRPWPNRRSSREFGGSTRQVPIGQVVAPVALKLTLINLFWFGAHVSLRRNCIKQREALIESL